MAANTGEGVKLLGLMEYGGYVRRIGRQLALDVGVSNVHLDRYNRGLRPALKYTEAYVGVTADNLSLHAYYAPNYLRPGLHTVYLDLSGAVRPADKWRAFGHVGLLATTNDAAQALFQQRWDFRAGVSREIGRAELQLAWVLTAPAQTPRPGGPPVPPRSVVILGASYFF